MSDVKHDELRSDTLSSSASAALRAQIEAALRNRQVQVQLWADGTGRVYRIQVVSSTGSAELDAVIRDDVLRSLMLSEPANEMPTDADGSTYLPADNNRQTIQHVE